VSLAATLRTLVVLSVAVVLSSAETRRTEAVPEHGSFTISFPSAWRYATEPSPEEGAARTMRLEPADDDRFLLRATAVWVPLGRRDAAQAASWMRFRLHGQTVELEIPVREFQGSRNTVYWFVATNRAPEPGAYEAMVQGATIVGELFVGFTLLYHPGDQVETDQVLKALGDARHLPHAP
jgi:hypothetical protein